MRSIKKVLNILMFFIIVGLISCAKTQESKVQQLDLFDSLKGQELAKEYFINIRSGDIDKANTLCDKELIDKNKNISQGVSSITGFQLDKSIIGSDFAYFIFNVIRDSSTEPKSDLENYIVKVGREKDKYSITEIKAKEQRQLYIKENALRIIGEKGGKSSLVITLNNIPKDTYLRDNELMLYKEKVPNNSFGKVVLGFTGEKIAVSTKNDTDSYICIVYIDDTLMQSGADEVSPGTPSQSASVATIQEVLEKPVSRKVVSVDLLNNSNIEDFIFSKEDDNLAVNYKNSVGIDRVNLYKAEDGTIINTNFNNSFPDDIYNVKAKYFDDDNLIISVYKNDSSKDDTTGEYSLNIKSKEMNKL